MRISARHPLHASRANPRREDLSCACELSCPRRRASRTCAFALRQQSCMADLRPANAEITPRYGAGIARFWSSCPRNGQRPGLSGCAQGLSCVQVHLSGERSNVCLDECAASLPFLSYKQRNAVLDNFFYDTARPHRSTRGRSSSPLADREGSIIVVPPSNSDRQIRHYKPRAPLHDQGGADHSRHCGFRVGLYQALGTTGARPPASRTRWTRRRRRRSPAMGCPT